MSINEVQNQSSRRDSFLEPFICRNNIIKFSNKAPTDFTKLKNDEIRPLFTISNLISLIFKTNILYLVYFCRKRNHYVILPDKIGRCTTKLRLTSNCKLIYLKAILINQYLTTLHTAGIFTPNIVSSSSTALEQSDLISSQYKP